MRKKECKNLIYLIHKPIFTEMLEESAYQNSFILSLSSPAVILFKSFEGMLTATSMNLNMTKIANVVVVNYKTLVTKKITFLLRKLCFTKKETQNIEKSTWAQSGSNAWKRHHKGELHQNTTSSIPKLILYPKSEVSRIPKPHHLLAV